MYVCNRKSSENLRCGKLLFALKMPTDRTDNFDLTNTMACSGKPAFDTKRCGRNLANITKIWANHGFRETSLPWSTGPRRRGNKLPATTELCKFVPAVVWLTVYRGQTILKHCRNVGKIICLLKFAAVAYPLRLQLGRCQNMA